MKKEILFFLIRKSNNNKSNNGFLVDAFASFPFAAAVPNYILAKNSF